MRLYNVGAIVAATGKSLLFSIIDKLLFREVIKTLLVIVTVLLLLMLANTLVRFLGQAAVGLIGNELMLVLIGLNMLKLAGFVIPPAFFFSILWVMGGMYRDSEMIALSAGGVGMTRLYRPFFITAIPVALLVGWLVMFVFPEAKAYAEQLQFEHESNIQLTGIKAGVFNEFDKGNVVIYAGNVNDEKAELGDVFVQHVQHGKTGVVVAESARIEANPLTGERFVILEKGRRYQGEPGKPEYSLGEFSLYGLRMPDIQTNNGQRSLAAKSTEELWQSNDLKARTELQFRLSVPLAVFALMLVSVPLARSQPRQGVYGRLGIAVIIYAVYVNLQHVTEKWMATGATPDWLGTWWLPLIMVLIALTINYFDSMGFVTRWNRMCRRRT
jgi:lipopolysaccharide export system permease protein